MCLERFPTKLSQFYGYLRLNSRRDGRKKPTANLENAMKILNSLYYARILIICNKIQWNRIVDLAYHARVILKSQFAFCYYQFTHFHTVAVVTLCYGRPTLVISPIQIDSTIDLQIETK